MLVTIQDKLIDAFGGALTDVQKLVQKQKGTHKFTEAEILADESIWLVSEGDEGDDYDTRARN